MKYKIAFAAFAFVLLGFWGWHIFTIPRLPSRATVKMVTDLPKDYKEASPEFVHVWNRMIKAQSEYFDIKSKQNAGGSVDPDVLMDKQDAVTGAAIRMNSMIPPGYIYDEDRQAFRPAPTPTVATPPVLQPVNPVKK